MSRKEILIPTQNRVLIEPILESKISKIVRPDTAKSEEKPPEKPMKKAEVAPESEADEEVPLILDQGLSLGGEKQKKGSAKQGKVEEVTQSQTLYHFEDHFGEGEKDT